MDRYPLRILHAARLWRWLLAAYWISLLVGTHLPPQFHAVTEELNDKVEHLFAYAGLAWLLAMAWQTSVGELTNRHLRFAWLAIVLSAMADELTQPFFDRDCSVWDWLADAIGVALGLAAFRLTQWAIAKYTGAAAENSVSPVAEPIAPSNQS
jgi:VanZ family protein